MTSFDIADQHVRAIEGGYANHPADRGGETYAGIARKRWPGWDGWQVIDQFKASPHFPGNIKHSMLQPLVREFYRAEFWLPVKGDLFPNQLLANQVYDLAVNGGTRTAGRYLQRTLNLLNRQGKDYADLVVDGWIGTNTLFAMQRYLNKRGKLGVYLLGFYLLVQQGALWVRLASEHPEQEEFMNGWGRRGLSTALQYAKQYLGGTS